MEELQNQLNTDLLVKKLEEFTLDNPHDYLGLIGQEEKIIRIYRPYANEIYLELFSEIVAAKKVHDKGLFEVECLKETTHLDYRIYHQNGRLDHDPYAFSESIDSKEIEKFKNDIHLDLHSFMGGRLVTFKGCSGARFTVYAPHAKSVSLICDTNYFDSRILPLRNVYNSGVFEIFVPGLDEGERYKFEIHTSEGHRKVKTDPYGTFFELRPKQAAILYDVDHFKWEDDVWMQRRKSRNHFDRPINIYELHLGSWKKKDAQFFSYKELAHDIVKYCQEMGYTDVELMPITEYPLDDSWGYQVTGYFGATSRYGSPEDFQYFVNHLHVNDIGVIIDWVPAHFPIDEFSLAKFDGEAVFEHVGFGIHPDWTTHYFDYSKITVVNFLLASALFWIEKYHIDGLRVDAVASIVHLDFGRKDSGWKPNKYGGNEHLEGIEFLKTFNRTLEKTHPDVLRIAEDTSTFQGVSHDIERGGLGFHYKWNLGFCQDVLINFLSKDFSHRHFEYHHLVFAFDYAFTEKFLIPLSHDEVTHERKSFLSKFFGEEEQKFSQYRSFLTLMMCYPGKKLTFMGQEFAQVSEWDPHEEIHWHILKDPLHQKLQNFVKDLNALYLSEEQFWKNNFDKETFKMLVDSADKQNFLAFLKGSLICCFNFGQTKLENIEVPVEGVSSSHTIFTTHMKKYGANEDFDDSIETSSKGVRVSLEPFSTCLIKVFDQ